MIKTDKNISSTYSGYLDVSEAPLEKKEYVQINEEFLKFVINLVQEGKEVTLPGKMGTLYVGGTKREKIFDEEGNVILPPNWAKTKALWEKDPQAKAERKRVFCLNEETDGVSYRYIWSKFNVPVQNKKMYKLRLTREHKRELSRLITKEKKEYIITKVIKKDG